MEELKPVSKFETPGAPDWIVIGESVWISNSPKGNLIRINPNTNRIEAVVPVGKKPCAGLIDAFGSIWVPLCGDDKVIRLDPKTNKITATIATTVGNSDGTIGASRDAIWLVSDVKGTLVRIDPASNKIVASIALSPGSTCSVGEGDSVWITNTEQSLLTHVDAKTNRVVATTPIGPKPLVLAVGYGSVWTFNQGDGTVSRVDQATDKLIANIDVGVPGPGGDVGTGGSSVWVGSFDIPLSRIDPATNKVVQQYTGAGGDAARFGFDSIWISNLRQQNVWRVDMKALGPLPAH
jgi:streptogramin lyase